MARQSWTHIGRNQPDYEREWDCQCARCGSSLDFELCDECGGEGFVEAEDFETSELDYVRCHACRGDGSFPFCLSSYEWCDSNPAEGRENVKGGTPEWYTFDPPKQTEDAGSGGV